MQSLVHKHNVLIQAWQPHILNVLMLLLRCYVAWVFWQAGYLKFTNWAATEYLFQFEYQVPILPWQVAAVVGTATELIVPIFIAIGLVTRLTGGCCLSLTLWQLCLIRCFIKTVSLCLQKVQWIIKFGV